ncbi:hypothetical protein [Streptomyces sp. NPDC048392]|uniref:hypothetical protein n=1 Tax=Streptomyces sp. NPDC048392 TaxID=3365543 RepID=UPI003710FDE4
MPRIQILPLPEGASDERPPSALVIDQANETTYQSLAYDSDSGQRPLHEALKADLGAQAILCFEDTVEIPANDVSDYVTPTVNIHVDSLTDVDSTALADQTHRGLEQTRIGSPR